MSRDIQAEGNTVADLPAVLKSEAAQQLRLELQAQLARPQEIITGLCEENQMPSHWLSAKWATTT